LPVALPVTFWRSLTVDFRRVADWVHFARSGSTALSSGWNGDLPTAASRGAARR
jgi:hypothetical protein